MKLPWSKPLDPGTPDLPSSKPESEALRFIRGVFSESDPVVNTAWFWDHNRTTITFPKVRINLWRGGGVVWPPDSPAWRWSIVTTHAGETLYRDDLGRDADVLEFLLSKGFQRDIEAIEADRKAKAAERERSIKALKREYLSKGSSE